MSITFDYDAWDDNRDVYLAPPANTSIALTYIRGAITPGHKSASVKEERRDPDIAPVVNSMVALLASTLEWFRFYEMSAEDVEQRVRAYLADTRGIQENRILSSVRKQQDEIADAAGLLERLDAATIRAIGR